MVIADLKKDIEKYEEEYKIFQSKGFNNFDKPRQMVSNSLIFKNIPLLVAGVYSTEVWGKLQVSE